MKVHGLILNKFLTYINYATTYALAADKYIVLEKAGRFNGLHKIESIGDNTGTNNKIILTTKYTGSESTWTDFEETKHLLILEILNDDIYKTVTEGSLELSTIYSNGSRKIALRFGSSISR